MRLPAWVTNAASATRSPWLIMGERYAEVAALREVTTSTTPKTRTRPSLSSGREWLDWGSVES
jgi:hypothetical protein